MVPVLAVAGASGAGSAEVPAGVSAVTVAVWVFALPAVVSSADRVVPDTCAVVPSSRATV